MSKYLETPVEFLETWKEKKMKTNDIFCILKHQRVVVYELKLPMPENQQHDL